VRTTTYLGLFLGIGCLSLTAWASGGDLSIFTHRAALLIVLGGTFAAATLASSRRTALDALSALSRIFLLHTVTTREVSGALVGLARQARAQGLATIDSEAVPFRDPFLVKGLRLLVDGIEAERIEALLRLESELLSARRAQAEQLFRLMGYSALLFGVAGTLIELIRLSPGLAESARLWPAVTASLAATCYGALLTGLCFLPLAGKVRTLDQYEQLVRHQVVTGLIAIRLGQNPEYLRESLAVFAQKNG
jgi:chemotaxis protein MotA